MFTQAQGTVNPNITNPTNINLGSTNIQPLQGKDIGKRPAVTDAQNQNQNQNQKLPQQKPIQQPARQPKVQKQGEPKPTNPAQKQQSGQQNPKSTTGGVLSRGDGKQGTNTKSSLSVDTSLHFGLQDLINDIVAGKQLGAKEVQKITKNFKMYVRDKNQPLSLDSITKQTQISQKNQNKQVKSRILDLHYLFQIQVKSQLIINQLWVSIIQHLFKKIPFLSARGCLQFVKLHISLNKSNYCQKGNEGNLDIKIFADPTLFQIIDNKIVINTDHSFYQSVFVEIENLIIRLFKGLNAVFKELSYLKVNQIQKYNRVFGNLQRNGGKKREAVSSLLRSFLDVIMIVPENRFYQNVQYLECIAESTWHLYLADSSIFDQNMCKAFLNNLNQNYKYFNLSEKFRSRETNNLVMYVQKIAVSFLLNQPLNFSKWNPEMKKLIFNSNLEMLKPFNFILRPDQRDTTIDIFSFQMRGLHWKQLIELVIKLNYKDLQTEEFIFTSITTLLQQNYNAFWQDPGRFENLFNFTQRLMKRASSQNDIQLSKGYFIKTLAIGNSLMGKSIDDPSQQREQVLIGVQYPQTKVLPFSQQVHNNFSQYFLRMDKKQFMTVISQKICNFIIQSKQHKTQQFYDAVDSSSINAQIVYKEYVAKLLLSEPNLLFDFRRYQSTIREDELLDWLIVQTIANPRNPQTLLDAAFTALDRLLVENNTSMLIENILGIDEAARPVAGLAQSIFTNQKVLPLVARHFGVLINLNYQSTEWSRQLLKNFYNYSTRHVRQLLTVNGLFVKSYFQLLSNILSRLNNNQSTDINELKHYINVPFIIESIKHYLRFDLHHNNYINIAVCQQSKIKLQALLQCIRLYNIILLYYLRVNTSKAQLEVRKTTGKKVQQSSRLFSAFEEKQMGIQDKQFSNQVVSLTQESTTYVNALTFILINATQQQKKVLKQINFDYEELIFQTIEALIKLNSKENIRKYFNIYKTNKPLFAINDLSLNPEKSYLNRFISYIEQNLNQTGIELIVFGNLIQDPQRLRKLIDKVRNRLQNSQVRQRIKASLFLKILSTLSRYFRNSMNQMSIKRLKLNLQSLQMKEHFDYLLQSIVQYTTPFKPTKKLSQLNMIDNILGNVYAALLTVQTFNRTQFFKWIKNYHPLLLNDINFRYLRNVQSMEQSRFTLGQEYFKLLSLFLNCQQFMSEKEFNIIANVKDLSQNLETFFINIVKYSEWTKLNEQLVDVLLEVTVMAIGLYVTVCRDKNCIQEVLSEVIDLVQDKKHQIKSNSNSNLIMLEMVLFNELQMKYQNTQINFNDLNVWPLQMNCISSDLTLPHVKNLIQSFKKSNLNNLSFVSICNGLFFLIQKSQNLEQSRSVLLPELFSVYKYLTNIVDAPLAHNLSHRNGFTSKSNYANPQQTLHAQNSSYKKVWILQLILAVLTNVQINPSEYNGQVQREFQELLIDNEDILKRFGFLMKKIALQQAQLHLPWLPQFQQSIHIQQTFGNAITFAQKLQLYQIMKLFNFAFASLNWMTPLAKEYVDLVEIFVSYRKVFERLLLSNKKQRASSVQEATIQTVDLKSYLLPHQMLSSGIQFQKQKFRSEVLKSSNSFELLHEMINLELSVQYSTICVAIALPFHVGMHNSQPQLADISKWNIVHIEFAQLFTQKHIQTLTNSQFLKPILNQFSQTCYIASEYNIPLSNQMLFTNSRSLSSCLDTTYDSVLGVLVGTLTLLLETIYAINKKLQSQMHVEYKVQHDKLSAILAILKKNDDKNFDYALYDAEEQKRRMTQTIRTNLSRSFANTQANQPMSRTIRNY